MFSINEKCHVNQFVAKKNFLEYADLSKVEKELLSSKVQKITLAYQLDPSRINVKPYADEVREYPLVNVIEIILTQQFDTAKLSALVMKCIPFPNLLVFRFVQEIQLAAAHQRHSLNDSSKNVVEEIVVTDWMHAEQAEQCIDFTRLSQSNFYTMYRDIVDAISVCKAKQCGIAVESDINGETARALVAKQEAVEAQITALRAQLKKETQFNRKMELNMEIKKLEKER